VPISLIKRRKNIWLAGSNKKTLPVYAQGRRALRARREPKGKFFFNLKYKSSHRGLGTVEDPTIPLFPNFPLMRERRHSVVTSFYYSLDNIVMIDFDVGHNIGLYLVEGHLDSNFYSGSIFEISQQKLPCPRLYTSPWGRFQTRNQHTSVSEVHDTISDQRSLTNISVIPANSSKIGR
jgi:hypothetical protein